MLDLLSRGLWCIAFESFVFWVWTPETYMSLWTPIVLLTTMYLLILIYPFFKLENSTVGFIQPSLHQYEGDFIPFLLLFDTKSWERHFMSNHEVQIHTLYGVISRLAWGGSSNFSKGGVLPLSLVFKRGVSS
jgi:hypothetical protein